MVTLKKQGQSSSEVVGIGELEEITAPGSIPDSWVEAEEFVPGQAWKGSGTGRGQATKTNNYI